MARAPKSRVYEDAAGGLLIVLTALGKLAVKLFECGRSSVRPDWRPVERKLPEPEPVRSSRPRLPSFEEWAINQPEVVATTAKPRWEVYTDPDGTIVLEQIPSPTTPRA